MIPLEHLQQISILICFVLLLVNAAAGIRLHRKLTEEIETIRFEQEKISFRLFVAEKKQKILQDRKTG